MAQVSQKTASKVLAMAKVILRLEWGRPHFQVHSFGCWQELVPCWLLAKGHPLFLVRWAVHRSAPSTVHGFIRLSKSGVKRGSAPKVDVTVNYNLFLEVTPHPLCHIYSLDANL